MIDPDDYQSALFDARLELVRLEDYDPTNLDDCRSAIRVITDVLDHLKDLQDELVEAEGLLDPDNRYEPYL